MASTPVAGPIRFRIWICGWSCYRCSDLLVYMNIPLAMTAQDFQNLAIGWLTSVGAVALFALGLWAKYGPALLAVIAELRAGIQHGKDASATNAAAIATNAQTIAQVATAVPTTPPATAKEIVGELLQQVNVQPVAPITPEQTKAANFGTYPGVQIDPAQAQVESR